MSLMTFWDKKIKKLNTMDMALVKLSVMGFTLMIAKLWVPLLSLDWYWYGIIFLIPVIILMKKIFK